MADPRTRAVDAHPQRNEIIDAILAGQSLTKLGKSLNPPIHQTALSRYKSQLLAPAIRAMRAPNDKTRAIKKIAIDKGMITSAEAIQTNDRSQATLTRNEANLKSLIEARIDKRLSRRERWIASAESQKIVDKDGEVHESMNHRALAAHDRNEGTDVEMLAKLGGLLANSQQPATLQCAVMMPVSLTVQVTPGTTGTQTIDIIRTETLLAGEREGD